MYLVKTYRRQSEIEGKGIFARQSIPKGTIVFIYGQTEKLYTKEDLQSLPEEERERRLKLIFEYGVEDEHGNWNVTEGGPDVGDINHSCNANILSLFVDGIYCDIAVRDIQKDEEITIDYGMFYSSFPWTMECRCSSPLCRKTVGSGIPVDPRTRDMWHSRISEATKHIFEVDQPLFTTENEAARRLSLAVKEKRNKNPRIFPYLKFSLISERYVGLP
jgi:hypothetical protein